MAMSHGDLLEACGDLGRRDNPERRYPDEEDNERAEYRKRPPKARGWR
jgi:hypothetical protein